MIACGGGKNGSGSQANLAVASSHRVRNNPSTSSHGARFCRPVPKRPSQLALNVATKIPPAITKAEIASSCVRDQSPRSSHRRHDKPKTIHVALAPTPAAFASSPENDSLGNDSAGAANAAPSSADCGKAATLDTEYVDI